MKPAGPLAATFYLSELVLQGMVGSPDVMHQQLLHLVAAVADNRCTIRIIPNAQRVYLGTSNAFRVLSYTDHDPVAIEELLVAVVFVDKPQALDEYAAVIQRLDRVAFNTEISRDILTEIADDHARLASA